ncbi:MAG: hypothetical protein V4594_23155 [Bacteroidota bacterium]
MKVIRNNGEEITSASMLNLLKKAGVEVRPDEAKLILEFFALLADILVEEFTE